MDRSNHYESAFEGYLQAENLCYVAVDERRRPMMNGAPVKSLDFIVYGPAGARLVIDIKGRRYPGGTSHKPSRVWQNWATREDVDGLERWAQTLGPGYRGLLVFVYDLAPEVELPPDTIDLFPWRRRRYLLRAVDVSAYRQRLKVRSPRWGTVGLTSADYRQIVHPLRHFTEGFAIVPLDCPF